MKPCFKLPLALLVLLPLAALAGPWPELGHPRDARIEPIGDRLRLNGIPLHVTRVLAPAPPAAVLAHYRQALGGPVAHSQIGRAQVLAQARGDFFVTVTIEPRDDGRSEALVSIADSRAAREAAGRALGLTLPAGSELLSDMESFDAGLASRQLVLVNSHSVHANQTRLSATLAERGLIADGPPLARSDDTLVQSFSGPSGAAQLVLVRCDGTTHAVLTLLSDRR